METKNHPDLVQRECVECEKKVYVVAVCPPEDVNADMIATGLYVSAMDDQPSFVLCDECADELYKKGRLGYSGTGDAFITSWKDGSI